MDHYQAYVRANRHCLEMNMPHFGTVITFSDVTFSPSTGYDEPLPDIGEI